MAQTVFPCNYYIRCHADKQALFHNSCTPFEVVRQLRRIFDGTEIRIEDDGPPIRFKGRPVVICDLPCLSQLEWLYGVVVLPPGWLITFTIYS
jgi:hypothetical protein